MQRVMMTKRASTTVRYETRATIDRPISDVFARLADLDGYRTWMRRTGLFRRSGQTSGGPIGLGTAYFDGPRADNAGVHRRREPPHQRGPVRATTTGGPPARRAGGLAALDHRASRAAPCWPGRAGTLPVREPAPVYGRQWPGLDAWS